MNIKELESYGINTDEVTFYLNKIKNEESIVTLAGEFSAGKSTFLNALISQKRYLPDGFGECTPVLLNLVKSDSDQMTVTLKNNQSFDVDNTYDNRLMYAKHTEGYDDTIHMLTIPVQSEFLKENVNYIDTPGSNTMLQNHIEISNYILSKSDIVVYVFNTSLGETDMDRIKGILKYTTDVIFVLSHIDEGNVYKSDEDIKRFVDSAQKDLESEFEILDELVILPIGSVLALEDDTYISVIREYMSDYLEENTMKVIKKRTENQLSILFEDKIEMFDNELALLNSGDSIEEIIRKMSHIEEEIEKLIAKQTEENSHTKRSADLNISEMIAGIQTRVEQSKNNLIHQLNSNSSSELVQEALDEEKYNLDVFIKEITASNIQKLLTEQYDKTNRELIEICETVNLEHKFDVTPPSLENLHTKTPDQTYHLEQLASYNNKLDDLDQLILAEEASQMKDKKKIQQYQMQLNEVKRDMMILGPYQPFMEDKVIEGSGKAAAKIGRVVGEVADIALLFVNPAGGTLAAADGVKDATKIASSAGKFAKATAKGKDVAKKAVVASKKTVATYKTIKQQADKLPNFVPETEEKSILDLLDYLSLGHWGESLGKFIGEQVDPTRTIQEESMEYQQLWDDEYKEIEARGYTVQTEINNLQLQIEDSSSIAMKKKFKKQLEEKMAYQDQMMKIKSKEAERETEKEYANRVIEHYTQSIKSYFENYLKVSSGGVQSILDQAVVSIENQCKIDLNKNIENLKSSIAKLSDSKDNIEAEVLKIQNDISELSKYKGWLNEWIEEASAN